jgi:hypothetical protein
MTASFSMKALIVVYWVMIIAQVIACMYALLISQSYVFVCTFATTSVMTFSVCMLYMMSYEWPPIFIHMLLSEERK